MKSCQQNQRDRQNVITVLLEAVRFWGVAIALSLVLCLSACDDLKAANPLAPPETIVFEQGLAEHLQRTGAKMYGAYWCPHCADQKALFGAAVKNLPYVECDPKGENPQPDLCQAKQIEGYPTWEIAGRLYPGTRSLLELATLSSYEAPSGSSPSPEATP